MEAVWHNRVTSHTRKSSAHGFTALLSLSLLHIVAYNISILPFQKCLDFLVRFEET